MNTNGLIPFVIAVFANIVSPIVHPSIITITMNGINSEVLISPSIFFCFPELLEVEYEPQNTTTRLSFERKASWCWKYKEDHAYVSNLS